MISISIFITDNVEMEIVLPGSMTVIDSHDIALALQHKIEAMVDVERAFVHVDHQERDGLEHKVNEIFYFFLFIFVAFFFFYSIPHIYLVSSVILLFFSIHGYKKTLENIPLFLSFIIAYPPALPPPSPLFYSLPLPFPRSPSLLPSLFPPFPSLSLPLAFPCHVLWRMCT